MNLLSRACVPNSIVDRQTGAVLIVGLIVLSVITLIAVSAMGRMTLEQKMATNLQDRQKALQAAESAARYAWSVLDVGSGFDVANFINNTSHSGYYDLRSTGINTDTGNKLIGDWYGIGSVTDWPWEVAAKRDEMPNKVAVDDPMKLATAPQFVIGMRAPVLRRGSENLWCIPFSIIGAGQGSAATTRSLVELQVIPKSGCYRVLVN